MQFEPSKSRPPMHPATRIIRQILELNEVMEFAMRREMGLNETDFQAMQHLIKHRSISPGDLSQFLHLTPAATTTVIDRLAEKGHITRIVHPTDRRRQLIEPSAQSVKDTMDRLMPMILEVDAKVRTYAPEAQNVIVDFLASVASSMLERSAAMGMTEHKTGPPMEQNQRGSKNVIGP